MNKNKSKCSSSLSDEFRLIIFKSKQFPFSLGFCDIKWLYSMRQIHSWNFKQICLNGNWIHSDKIIVEDLVLRRFLWKGTLFHDWNGDYLDVHFQIEINRRLTIHIFAECTDPRPNNLKHIGLAFIWRIFSMST